MRLQSKNSNYSVKEFSKDRRKKEEIIKNISEFPFKKSSTIKRYKKLINVKPKFETNPTIQHFIPQTPGFRVSTTLNQRNES
mmetsp:Transcript_28186/g.32296  ORF Transcript_28186/g.32296 Transcript_28186/m.32296 type:complete len:82 (+) Transcript_28186:71-316(+)